MPQRRVPRHTRIGPTALTRTLAWLRLCAIAGQSAAIAFSAWVMQLPIPVPPLLAGVGVLVLFEAFALWRLRHPVPVREWEAIGHIAVDTLVLGYLLYFTGGAGNPFSTLLLVPIAMSAAALRLRAIMVVAALAGLAYLMLLIDHVPLPLRMTGFGRDELSLHVAGTGVNFVIMALMLGVFIKRLAMAVSEQQKVIQRGRERALRDEGILAIATQAAGAAHELNTPLSTMRTLLPEVRREHADDGPLADDLDLLQEQVERCRSILREMVAFGKAQLSQESEQQTLRAFIHGCTERFALLRPEAELLLEMDEATADMALRTPPGLRHALINLLNNAADASSLEASQTVELSTSVKHGWLQLKILDHGPGFDQPDEPSLLGQSDKQEGLGIGLALADATAERLNGKLLAENTARGAQVTLCLPLAVIGTS